MLITPREIVDMAIMTGFVGFIFADLFGRLRKPRKDYDPLIHGPKSGFDWDNFKFAIMAIAPALILHELGHKFVALHFGLAATFHAAYFWLLLGLVLKLMRFHFIFFVPAYVAVIGMASPLEHSLIAFAGPLVNMILWLGIAALVKYNKIQKKYHHFALITSKVNMFLFIFNMIPIPGFDGSKVFSGLIGAFL